MKVSEALNLYNLHSKPETLDKHAEASEKLKQKFNFIVIPYHDLGVSILLRQASVSEFFQSFKPDSEDFYIQPFDNNSLGPILMDLRKSNESEIYEKQLIAALQKITPKTHMFGSLIHHRKYFSCIAITDAPTDLVEIAF